MVIAEKVDLWWLEQKAEQLVCETSEGVRFPIVTPKHMSNKTVTLFAVVLKGEGLTPTTELISMRSLKARTSKRKADVYGDNYDILQFEVSEPPTRSFSLKDLYDIYPPSKRK